MISWSIFWKFSGLLQIFRRYILEIHTLY